MLEGFLADFSHSIFDISEFLLSYCTHVLRANSRSAHTVNLQIQIGQRKVKTHQFGSAKKGFAVEARESHSSKRNKY